MIMQKLVPLIKKKKRGVVVLINLSASQSTYLLMSVTSLISVDTSAVCFVFFPVVLLQETETTEKLWSAHIGLVHCRRQHVDT